VSKYNVVYIGNVTTVECLYCWLSTISSVLYFVFSREIADGIVQIEQLAADKTELEKSLGACREAYEKLCQEKNDLAGDLEASRSQYTTATNQLDVRSISDTSVFYCFERTFVIEACM